MLANINQLFKLDQTIEEGEFIIKTRPGTQNARTDPTDESSPQLAE